MIQKPDLKILRDKYLLMLDRFSLDKNKIIAIVISSVIIIYLDVTVLLKMQIEGVKKDTPQIAQLKSNLDQLNRELSRMQQLKSSQLKVQQAAIARSKKVISEEQIPGLLKLFSDVANAQGVRIEQMRPLREAPQAGLSDKLTPLLVSLELVCDYHRLGKFINDLENSDIFLEVQRLRIFGQADNILTQKVGITLKTYIKK